MSSKQYSWQNKDLQDIPQFNQGPPDQLNLAHNQLTHIKPLVSITSLTQLNVSYNQLTELADLSSLIHLKTLNIGHNAITSLANIGHLPSVCVLLANDNQIDSMRGLEQCLLLNVLVLSRNRIKKIEGISKLHKLGKLTLSGNEIEMVTGIEELTQLRELRLNNNRIKKLQGSCLESVDCLLLVDLGNNLIDSFEECKALAGNKYLRDLNIQGNSGSFEEQKQPEKTELLMSWFPNLVVYNSAHAKSKPKRGLSKVTVAKQRSKFMKRIERRKTEEEGSKKEKKRGLNNKVERIKQKDSRTNLPTALDSSPKKKKKEEKEESKEKKPTEKKQVVTEQDSKPVEKIGQVGLKRKQPVGQTVIKKKQEPVKSIKRDAKKLAKTKVLSEAALRETSETNEWD